jgi:hypothetical protein
MVLGSGMAKTGRPTTYRRDVEGRIIDAVAGGASLKDAALAAGVPRTTVNEWARDDRDSFGVRLKQAQAERYHLWEEQLVELADGAIDLDSMAKVQGRKLAIDVRRWIMARRMPEVWGEQVAHQHQLAGNATIHISLPAKGSGSDRGGTIEGEAREVLGHDTSG